jgi:hypothetical protein
MAKKNKKPEAEVQTTATNEQGPQAGESSESQTEAAPRGPRKADEMLIWDTGKEPEAFALPEGPDDPTWDHRMNLPKSAIKEMEVMLAEEEPESPLQVLKKPDGTYGWVDGRTRRRAVEGANKLRAKLGKAPLVFLVQVKDIPEVNNIGMVLNVARIASPPLIEAAEFARGIDKGFTEEEMARGTPYSPAQVKDRMSLLGLSDLWKKALNEEKVSLAAALEAAKMDTTEADEKLTKLIAETTGKVTKAAVEKASGKDVKARMSVKEARSFQETIKATRIKGDNGEFLKAAMVAALNVVDDPRLEDEFWGIINKLAQGKLPKAEESEAEVKATKAKK